jgi:hypothetical protein
MLGTAYISVGTGCDMICFCLVSSEFLDPLCQKILLPSIGKIRFFVFLSFIFAQMVLLWSCVRELLVSNPGFDSRLFYLRMFVAHRTRSSSHIVRC